MTKKKDKFKCGQCGRFFDTQEDVYSHSHTDDIAEQMREEGESEDRIEEFMKQNKELGY